MSEEWFLFLLGVIVSIPIGVLTPFLTNRLQQKLGEKTRRDALRRRRTLEREMAEALDCRNSFPKFITFVLTRLVLITLVTYAAMIVPELISMTSSFVLATSSNTPDYSASARAYSLSQYIQGGSYVVEVIGFGVVVQICLRTMKVCNRVVGYDKYIQAWRNEILRLRDSHATSVVSQAAPKDSPHGAGPQSASRSAPPAGPRVSGTAPPQPFVPLQTRAGGPAKEHNPPSEPPTLPSWEATPYGARPMKEKR